MHKVPRDAATQAARRALNPQQAEYADRAIAGEARGRGAAVNPPNRFEPVRLSVLGEHLEELRLEQERPAGVATRVFVDRARTLINPVDSPDLPFSWTINPYRGCEHGCIYCYARPTHETFGLSCGLDFETQIFAKVEAPAMLRRELASPKWNGEPIVMSGVTDAYQPVERQLKLTRGCLEVMAQCGQPVSIVTKNHLVTRDADLLGPLAAHGAAHVAISITTLDRELAAAMEPRASAPADRLRAIDTLSRAGVPVAVMVAPVIPGLTDHEMPAILEAAARAGARRAGYILLRLPHQLKEVFADWLARRYPERARKVEGLIREARDGALSDPRFGSRFRGSGARAAQIGAAFELFRKRAGLDERWEALRSDAFVRPAPPMEDGQLPLFG